MRYLSAEWLDAADEAVRLAAPTAPAAALTIDQHIDGDDGATSYRVVIDGDSSRIDRLPCDGDGPASNASFHQSQATAIAIARGDTDAHQAYLLGQIRFVGDIDVLIDRADAFVWLEGVLQPVMARTAFSSAPKRG